MEKTCPKRNILVCISVLAALNLGIVFIAAQMPISSLGFDRVVQRIDAQVNPLYAAADVSKTNYRFQNCMGGESVNCHTNGNQAGL